MNYKRILVFGAHPDDEMTMSGTMVKFSQAGRRVVVVTMADGSEGYPRVDMKDQVAEMRRQEAAEADKVLGIARRVMLNCPDMAVVNDKETLKKCIQIIREEKPEAVFTHGPSDRHRDHLNTHAITIEAVWHAGQPVSSALGPSWRTPYLYYYKGCPGGLPTIEIDVTDTAYKRLEAWATQVSQHTLARGTKEEFLEKAKRMKESGEKQTETFWIMDWNIFTDFLPTDLVPPPPPWQPVVSAPLSRSGEAEPKD